MNNTSPFSFLESLATRFQPPAWVVDEGQQRLVLFLNHVLQQEKLAQNRLLRQKGRVAHMRWGLFAIDLIVTPAGLVDRAPALSKPDLVLSVAAESPVAFLQAVLASKAPPVKIEGDVQLAADIGWLAENLRWDAEEDLSRLMGDAPAHALADVGRRVASSLKQYLATGPLSSSAPTAPTSSTVSTTASAPPQSRSAAPFSPPSDVSPKSSQDDFIAAPPVSDETQDVKSAGTPPLPEAAA